MLTDLGVCAAGIAILLTGGELLVRGAATLARRLGVPTLVVGLTVVAFGTSAPELAVSVSAALAGSPSLAFGNIFGSNLANIGLIVGLTAMIRPLSIGNVVVRRELPMMLLAVAAAAAMGFDLDLGGRPSTYTRNDGIVFLLFFFVFLYYTMGDLMDLRNGSTGVYSDMIREPTATGPSVFVCLVLFAVGLAGLLFGAHMTVTGGVAVARVLGVPEVLLGLTVVSVGTSLPELVAALSAVRHGEVDLAVGGVVGSNIFNVLLVCGVTAVIEPMPIPPGGQFDLAATAGLSLALMLAARTHRSLILRYEAAGLLVAYLGYMVWRTLYLLPPAAQS